MRKSAFIVIPLLLVVGLLLSGIWYWASGLMLERLETWAAARRAEGIAVSWQEAERSGFPLTVAGRLTAPKVNHPLGWRWSGEALRSETTLLSLNRFALEAIGEQQVVWPGKKPAEAPASLKAVEARGEALFDDRGQAEWLQVTLRDWQVRGPFPGGSALGAAADIRIERADDDLGYPEGALGAGDLRLRNLNLPPEFQAPLGNNVALLDLTAILTGAHPDLKDPPRRILAAWRDSGGTLDISHLALDWGPLTIKGDGRLTLDDAFRPLGAFSLKVKGLGETLDLLARKGLIEGGAAFALQAGSLALGKADPEDGRPEVQIPLTLQDGWLSLGPLPLVRLKPIPLPD